MILFSRYCEDFGPGQIDRSLMAVLVSEIGCLPPHNSESGHSRLMVGLMQNFVPCSRVKGMRNISSGVRVTRYKNKYATNYIINGTAFVINGL
jgi:hypothetical protein